MRRNFFSFLLRVSKSIVQTPRDLDTHQKRQHKSTKVHKYNNLKKKYKIQKNISTKVHKHKNIQKLLKLKGSSYDIRPSIYVLKGLYNETPKKVAITVILGAKAFLPPPA